MQINHEITIYYRDGTKEIETVDMSCVENGCLVTYVDANHSWNKNKGHRYIPLDMIKEWRTDI